METLQHFDENAIVVFDGDNLDWSVSLAKFIRSGLIEKCILFIATGKNASAIEDYVDGFLIENDLFFPTVSEQNMDDLLSIILGWEKGLKKGIYIISPSDELKEALVTKLL